MACLGELIASFAHGFFVTKTHNRGEKVSLREHTMVGLFAPRRSKEAVQATTNHPNIAITAAHAIGVLFEPIIIEFRPLKNVIARFFSWSLSQSRLNFLTSHDIFHVILNAVQKVRFRG